MAVDGNASLTSLQGLEGIRELADDLSVQDNDSLLDLHGLSGLEWVGGHITITDDPLLSSISGLSSLQQVGGDVTIRANSRLCEDHVRDVFADVIVGGTLTVGNGSFCE